MSNPYAGIGGSYIQNPDGSLTLLERTGYHAPEEAGAEPEPASEAPAAPESKPASTASKTKPPATPNT
jgi:hypothetical protein